MISRRGPCRSWMSVNGSGSSLRRSHRQYAKALRASVRPSPPHRPCSPLPVPCIWCFVALKSAPRHSTGRASAHAGWRGIPQLLRPCRLGPPRRKPGRARQPGSDGRCPSPTPRCARNRCSRYAQPTLRWPGGPPSQGRSRRRSRRTSPQRVTAEPVRIRARPSVRTGPPPPTAVPRWPQLETGGGADIPALSATGVLAGLPTRTLAAPKRAAPQPAASDPRRGPPPAVHGVSEAAPHARGSRAVDSARVGSFHCCAAAPAARPAVPAHTQPPALRSRVQARRELFERSVQGVSPAQTTGAAPAALGRSWGGDNVRALHLATLASSAVSPPAIATDPRSGPPPATATDPRGGPPPATATDPRGGPPPAARAEAASWLVAHARVATDVRVAGVEKMAGDAEEAVAAREVAATRLAIAARVAAVPLHPPPYPPPPLQSPLGRKMAGDAEEAVAAREVAATRVAVAARVAVVPLHPPPCPPPPLQSPLGTLPAQKALGL